MDEVDELLARWFRDYTKHEAMKLLGDAGVPVGAVLTTEELMEDPYLRERGMFVPIQHPHRGEMVVPGWPVRMSGSPTQIKRSPLLGEHNSEVYAEWLGMDGRDLVPLRAEGVI